MNTYDAASTGPELYAEALRLRREAREQYDYPSEEYAQCIAEAQLCATLALTAATATAARLNDSASGWVVGMDSPDQKAWDEVCGVKPS